MGIVIRSVGFRRWYTDQRRIQDFLGVCFLFFNFDCVTRIYFIVVDKQCLQYVFYSIFSLKQHRVCVKGQQTPDPKILRTRPPILKFLDPPQQTAYVLYSWSGTIEMLKNDDFKKKFSLFFFQAQLIHM